jgi:molybdate transport system ATP-binding protein
MDEPLASLDDARKAEILPYVERLRDEAGIPIVYVSHSVAEVARLATDVVALSGGRVVASGPATDVLARLHLVSDEGRGEAGALIGLDLIAHDEACALSHLRSTGGDWRLPRIDAAPGTRLRARIRARDVMIATERPTGISALNILRGTVAEVTEDAGPEALVTIDCSGDRLLARVTRHSVQALDLHPGRPVFAVIKAVSFDGTNLPGPTPRPADAV